VRARVAVLACAACGATPAAAPPMVSGGYAEPPAAAPVAAPVATVVAPPDASAAADTSVAAVAPVAPLAAAAPAIPIAPSCRGAALDLRALAQRRSCIVDAPASPKLPPAIALSVAPAPVEVRAGRVAHATLILTNTSDADVTLLLDNACDRLTEINAVMLDAHGDRVDLDGGECGGVEGGCSNQTVGIALPPGGTADLSFDVDGRKERVDHQCRSQRVGRVAPGSYDLDVVGADAEVHAKVRVR